MPCKTVIWQIKTGKSEETVTTKNRVGDGCKYNVESGTHPLNSDLHFICMYMYT